MLRHHLAVMHTASKMSSDKIEQMLRDKWERLFFPRTVVNETNFFVLLDYRTDMPESGSDKEQLTTKHSKVIGFIESRIKNFLAIL